MKTGIHPNYNKGVMIECACGAKFMTGSTHEVIKTEICSACHPFYTGKKKLVDTAGRVEKYLAKVKKAQARKELDAKKVDEEMDEIVEEIEEKTSKVDDKKKSMKKILVPDEKPEEEEEVKEAA